MLMCQQITGIFAHEILGIGSIILFVIHQILNINFYKNIFKGKYTKTRVTYLIIDVLLLLMMLGMIISAILISQYVFKFMNISNDSLGREIHILTAYCIYIISGLHLGLHYNSFIKLKQNKKVILNIFLILFAIIFGIKGFVKREFIQKITLQSIYPLYFEDSIFIFLIEYLGIFVMFMMLGYVIYNLNNFKKKK